MTSVQETNNSRKHASNNYDVFLSFRGPDTRTTFLSYLYRDLKAAGIDAFKDDDELNFGGVIAEEIPRAIDNSRIYMPIFSETYASSKWCLLELAKMMMKAKQLQLGKEIIPIFYKVTVDDVKLKTDLYRKELNAHRKKEMNHTVEEWEKALKWVTQHRGWVVPAHSLKGDAEFCQEIVKHVSGMLKVRRKLVAEPLFGQDYQEQKLVELLEMESHDKVLVVGIHGMGGIGKTTLAKVLFNKLYDAFHHCSFLSDVRQTLSDNKSKGCLEVQKKLLGDAGYGCGNIYDSDDAIRSIGAKFRGERVLIVLDDVNKENQIKSILGDCSLLGGGSRIIVTTRDVRTLPSSKRQNVKSYDMEELTKEDALQLFSWHAFRELSPPVEYTSLCDAVVPHLTGGVPLCLTVIGSLLYGKGEQRWQSIIRKLEKTPAGEIQEKLMISYEDLSEGAKEIFLDIACFFVNNVMTNAVYMWESCDYFPEEGIDELVSMSLIKIQDSFENRKFWMHDQIRDLGREIIRREELKDKGQRSRFWEEKKKDQKGS